MAYSGGTLSGHATRLAPLAVALVAWLAPGQARAQLSADPDPIDFATVPAGSTDSITVTIANAGGTVDFVSCSILGVDAGAYSIANEGACSGPIGSGGNAVDLIVEFSPDAIDSFGSATLEIVTTGGTLSVDLDGVGGSYLDVTPNSIAFGNQQVGTTSGSDTITITNGGDVTMTVNSVTIPGANDQDYVISGFTPNTAVAAGDSINVSVAFAPDAADAQNATLVVTTSNSVGDSENVTLTGTGVVSQINVNPGSLAFGTILVGTTATRTFDIENTGGAPLEVTGFGYSGTNPARFTVLASSLPMGEVPFTLNAGQSETVTVRYSAPASAGSHSAVVTVNSNAQDVTDNTVSVSGTASAGNVSITSGPVSYGQIRVGQSGSDTITIDNTGNVALQVGAVFLTDGTDFTITTSLAGLPWTINPGNSRTVDIDAAPTTVGAVSDTLRIQTNIPGSLMVDVALVAEGIAPNMVLSAPEVNFGSHDVQNSTPTERTLTVTNTGGAELVISEMYLEDEEGNPYSDGLFAIVNPAAATVAPTASHDIQLTYRPFIEGPPDTAVLVIESDNLEDMVVNVPILGQGSDRQITVSANRIEFPPAYRNTDEAPIETLTIENSGNAALALADVMVTNGDASSFEVLEGAPNRVLPGQTVEVEIAFRPVIARAEPLEAEFLIVNDDDNLPRVRIELAGTGILPELAITPGAIDFGRAGVGVPVRLPAAVDVVRIANMNAERGFEIREVRIIDDAGRPLDDYYRVVDAKFPLQVESLESLEFDIEFLAAEERDYSGKLQILVGSDPEPVAEIRLTASAEDVKLRGGGCASAGGSGLAGALVVVGLLVLFAPRRRRGAVLALLVGLAHTGAAEAQPSRDLDLEPYRQRPGIRSSYLAVESTETGDRGSLGMSLSASHSLNPLRVESADGEMSYAPVSSRFGFLLLASFAATRSLEVGASLPYFNQSGESGSFGGVEPADGSALGDLGLHAKLFLLESGLFRFGASWQLNAPTATDESYAGSGGLSGQMNGLAELVSEKWAAGFNLGGRYRPTRQLADAEQGAAVAWGLAYAYRFHPALSAVGEVRGGYGIDNGASAASRPLELAAGVRYQARGGLHVSGGFARGIMPGIGVADLRTMVSVSYVLGDDTAEERLRYAERLARAEDTVARGCGAQGCEADADSDGIPDRADLCPAAAEDSDEFKDGDGCPDPDNDEDGIEDADDACPNEKEDEDGFEDGDGCEELDNDRDGVADLLDQCPKEPETINGREDDDGCPDEGETLVLVAADRIEIYEAIRFGRRDAEIQSGSLNVLGQVAATLRAHRELGKVEIRSHVHPGLLSPREAVALTQQRAEAIRQWLIDWGVEPERLTATGAGDRETLLSPKKRGARGINDRVEFVIRDRVEER